MFVVIDMYAFTCAEVVQRFKRKIGVMALEESIALQELAFDALGVSARSKRLSVPIFLVTLGASRRACGAAWML